MEQSIAQLDFLEVDQTVQIHGMTFVQSEIHFFDTGRQTMKESVSLRSRDRNSKAAAAEASCIFQSHYPELLVSPTVSL
jgi:phosphatidylinositol transfer protein SFH5